MFWFLECLGRVNNLDTDFVAMLSVLIGFYCTRLFSQILI